MGRACELVSMQSGEEVGRMLTLPTDKSGGLRGGYLVKDIYGVDLDGGEAK